MSEFTNISSSQSSPQASEFNVATDMAAQEQNDNWIKRHKTVLGLAGFAVAGAFSLTHSDGVISDIEHAAAWAAPAIVTTEVVAWAGGGMMIMAAGKKIGNPLTIKPRLKAVATELVDNKYYQRGWKIAATGATGTAAVITTGAVTSLPKETWPLALSIAGASLGFSSLSLPHKKSSQKAAK